MSKNRFFTVLFYYLNILYIYIDTSRGFEDKIISEKKKKKIDSHTSSFSTYMSLSLYNSLTYAILWSMVYSCLKTIKSKRIKMGNFTYLRLKIMLYNNKVSMEFYGVCFKNTISGINILKQIHLFNISKTFHSDINCLMMIIFLI